MNSLRNWWEEYRALVVNIAGIPLVIAAVYVGYTWTPFIICSVIYALLVIACFAYIEERN